MEVEEEAEKVKMDKRKEVKEGSKSDKNTGRDIQSTRTSRLINGGSRRRGSKGKDR